MGLSLNKLISNKRLIKFCKDNHIKKLSLFGSALSDSFNYESDVDLLVEFESGHVPGLFKLVEMEEEISPLFDGRKIDLRTPNDISRYFRSDVLESAEVLYAKS